MIYTRDDLAIIQGKCPHARVALRDFLLQELSVKKDSYQYDTDSCMMSILPTWHKWDLNANMHDDNMSIPSTYNKGISKHNMTNHDNKYITHMIPHHIKQGIIKMSKKQYPTSNIKQGPVQCNA